MVNVRTRIFNSKEEFIKWFKKNFNYWYNFKIYLIQDKIVVKCWKRRRKKKI